MGGVLLAGGLVGAAAGVQIFNILREMGQVDLLVSLCYVVFLGIIGALMFVESLNAIRRSRSGRRAPQRRRHGWVHALPFKMKFRTTGLYISAMPPLVVGVLVGLLAAIMGVGGGFIMVPAMIYILGMPTKVVVGTSLFQIIFVTAFTTLLHAMTNYTVDMLLAVLLLVGGVIGAQIGTQIGTRMKAEQLRILLALMVLGVCGKLALDLLLRPAELYSLGWGRVMRWLALLLAFARPRRGAGGGGRPQPEPDLDHRRLRRLRDPGLRRGQARRAGRAGRQPWRHHHGRRAGRAGDGAPQVTRRGDLGQHRRGRYRRARPAFTRWPPAAPSTRCCGTPRTCATGSRRTAPSARSARRPTSPTATPSPTR